MQKISFDDISEMFASNFSCLMNVPTATTNMPKSVVQLPFSFQYVNIRVQQKQLTNQPTKGLFSETRGRTESTDCWYFALFCFLPEEVSYIRGELSKKRTGKRSVTCFVFFFFDNGR